MSITLKKPFYSLKIQSEYCGYYACINGCYVDVNEDGVPQTIEYPINHWIRNGENQIEIYFVNTIIPGKELTHFYPEARFDCRLMVRENDGTTSHEVARLCVDGSEFPRNAERAILYEKILDTDAICRGSTIPGSYALESDKLVDHVDGEFIISNIRPITESIYTDAPLLILPVTVPTPFPEWAFFHGEKQRLHYDLNDDEWDIAREELIPEYQKIADVLEKRDFEALAKMMEIRCREYDIAFYKNPGDDLAETIDMFERDLADPEWPIREISKETVEVIVQFNQRLVSMTGFGNPMGAAVALVHTKSNLAKKYPILLSKLDGEWKIVR